jgi:hypothetical protein
MRIFSLARLLGLAPPTGRRGQPSSKRHQPDLKVEQLDSRELPAAVISGFVYYDANNNGIRDPGEQPIANSTLQLRNAAGTVIATTISGPDGSYTFDHDQTVDTSEHTTPAETLPFSRSTTTWSNSGTLAKFNPALGTLIGVEVINSGTIFSSAKVESTDASAQTITSQVNALLQLQGPGFAALQATDTSSQTFQATAYDRVTDYGGTSGRDLGERQVPVSRSTLLTSASALALYTGTGTVSFTETANGGTSFVGSSGGNLQSVINTEGEANVSVIYHYIPSNALQPGNYVIVQTPEPSGYIDGYDTAGNQTPIPHSNTTDTINVTLTNGSSTNNNFGEIRAAGLSGVVYQDLNNDGARENGEAGIAQVTIILTGTDDRGLSVSTSTLTRADGSYQFLNLRPGSYVLREVQPAGYLDGIDTIGTQGGLAGNDVMTGIVLQSGEMGINNNFGEIPPASVGGWVYFDKNNNGRREPGERGIGGVLITLTGTDIFGNAVTVSQMTAPNGSYRFNGLAPGTYTIIERQPHGWIDGRDSLGSLGGVIVGNDRLMLSLGAAARGQNYNFGERLPQQRTNPAHVVRGSNGKGDLIW